MRDYRQSVSSLTPAIGDGFSSVQVLDFSRKPIIQIPTNDIVEGESKSLFSATINQYIYSNDDERYNIAATVFQYSILPQVFICSIISIYLFFIFSKLFRYATNKIQEQQSALLNQRELEAVALMSSQVAHDIRSPLSALSMIASSLKEIPEEKRILIRNATQRINDIANELLQKGNILNKSIQIASTLEEVKFQDERSIIDLKVEFIPALVDILISEKRMQYREYAGLEIDVDLQDSFGAFAQINSNELKRVISNLVNNSIEAFNDHQGKVTVGVKNISCLGKYQVEIFIKDNGKGIPKQILEKLGQPGITFGKEGTQSGSGLGVYHAKKTIESFGGNFEINSVEGKGTTIRMILSLAQSPVWFTNKIELTGKKYLVTLDDDISIHQIWSDRLSSLGFCDIEHIKFQSGDAFEKYINSNINKMKQSVYLVDYELLNQTKTGLDIIEDLVIEKSSILVTSHYEESNIQERAMKIRLPILPKSLAGFVPIENREFEKK